MSVTPTDIVIDGVTIPTLTLAAGSTGGLGVAASIDPVNDYLAIYQNSSTSTLGINRNTVLGLSSAPVGLTDTQTLTNKTLTSPTIAGPVLSGTVGGTYTLGGTPTFPASVATLTGAQVLTNKTLTSPTINSPSITNATLTTDAVTGYTTSNSGVVYGGLTMTTGNAAFSGNATVGGTLGVTGLSSLSGGATVQGNPVWQYLGYVQITSNITTTSSSAVYATGLTVSVTIPTGATKVRVSVYTVSLATNSASGLPILYLYSGASAGALTTLLQQWNGDAGSGGAHLTWISSSAPSAGAIVYNAAFSNNGSYTTTLTGGPNYPAYILVECC